jgi:ubiquinone/menaquinone biosynthesis C-methylase UbiE
MSFLSRFQFSPSLVGALAASWIVASLAAASTPASLYLTREPSGPDGTGRWFQGREIAHVMGHEGAEWLERSERESEEHTARLVPLLEVAAGDHVADVGAGTGYFTWRLAQAVGPQGRVYAVDIQPEMLALLRTNLAARGVANVVPVLGSDRSPQLPAASLDLVLMVDVYHEFTHPYEMLAAICRALKPRGRVAFVEYRGEDPTVPIKPLHKMTERQIRQEAELHELEWLETIRTLPRQHLILFQKREDVPRAPGGGGSTGLSPSR